MLKDNNETWLTASEAAERLNLSVDRLYHLKNKLTHKKAGDNKSSRVFFLERTLFGDYTS